MTKRRWEALADFLNSAEIVPNEPHGNNPPLPSSLYDEWGLHGVSYKLNGQREGKWFRVPGPNAPAVETTQKYDYKGRY